MKFRKTLWEQKNYEETMFNIGAILMVSLYVLYLYMI